MLYLTRRFSIGVLLGLFVCLPATAAASGPSGRGVVAVRHVYTPEEQQVVRLTRQGVDAVSRHDYAGAEKTWRGGLAKALALKHSTVKNLLAANILESLGLLEFVQARYDQALADDQQALKLRDAGVDGYNVAVNLSAQAAAHAKQQQFPQAADCFERALPLFRKAGSDQKVAFTLYNLGTIYFAMGAADTAQYAKSGDAFTQALGLFEQQKSPKDQADCWAALGRVYQKQGRNDKADAAFARAKELAGPG